MRYWLMILAVLTGVSCSSSDKKYSYTTQLQSWIGQSEQRLYQAWGRPHNVFYVSPYEKVVTYVTASSTGERNPYQNQLYYEGMGEDNGWWDKLFGPPSEKQPRNYYCKTTFTIKNAQVVNFGFNGDDCVFS